MSRGEGEWEIGLRGLGRGGCWGTREPGRGAPGKEGSRLGWKWGSREQEERHSGRIGGEVGLLSRYCLRLKQLLPSCSALIPWLRYNAPKLKLDDVIKLVTEIKLRGGKVRGK